MSLRHLASVSIAGLGLLLAASCVLDRDGRNAPETNAGGSGGGPVSCRTDADCPDEICTIAACVDDVCRAIPEDTGTPCGEGRTCDVAAVCKIPDGSACEDGADCHSGACADGICCDTDCVGLCVSCTVGAIGVCEVIPAGTDPDDECVGDGVCGGQPACAFGNHLWSQQIASTEDTTPNAVAVDTSGNVIYALTFSGQITVGATVHDASITESSVVLVKADADGAPLFSHELFASNKITVQAIATDAEDNIYVVGDFVGTVNLLGATHSAGIGTDGFLLVVDASGALVWSESFSGTMSNTAHAVALTPDGGVVVVGSFDGPHLVAGVTHDPTVVNDSEVWAAKFAADQTHVWTRTLPHAGNDFGEAVAVTPDGMVLVGGGFSGTFETFTSDGSDAFVVVLDDNGTVVNVHTWVQPGDQRIGSLGAMPDGGFAAAGAFDTGADFGGGPLPYGGNADAFLAVFAADGAHRWSESYGAMGQQIIAGLTVDAIGNVVIAGSFFTAVSVKGQPIPNAGLQDPFIAKLSEAGALIWARGFGGAEYERLHDVAVGSDNTVVTIGELGTTTINAGGDDLTNMTLFDDTFLVKLTP